MNDQASELRHLVRHNVLQLLPPTPPCTRLILVTAGKRAVGVSTLAVHLAVSLRSRGAPTLLVDADPVSADATDLCGLAPECGLSHVLAGWRTLAETVLPGPRGIHVLPGAWTEGRGRDTSPAAHDRLIAQLRRQAAAPEYVVVDGGSAAGALAAHFWQAADLVLMVTTPDVVAIMDAYAVIKQGAAASPAPVLVFVNRADDGAQAADVQTRLARSCQRFLNLHLIEGGHLPELDLNPGDGRPQLAPWFSHPVVTVHLQRLAATVEGALATMSKRLQVGGHQAAGIRT
jgi:flagellar biosynthesis protein FlhG